MGQTASLRKAGGKLPTKDTRTFNKILGLVIDNWELTKPVDIMLANRMVATFMKLKHIDTWLDQKGEFYEDEKGKIILNPMTAYSRNLQNDLMRFYRLFQARVPKSAEEGPTDFASWIDENTKEIKPTKIKD